MTATLDQKVEQVCTACQHELDPEWTYWARNAGLFCSIACLLASEVSV